MTTSRFEQQDDYNNGYYEPYLFSEMEETEGMPKKVGRKT